MEYDVTELTHLTMLYSQIPWTVKCNHLESDPISLVFLNIFKDAFINYISSSGGLRGREVTFPPLDPSDAGSNPEGTESSGRDFKPFDPCSIFAAR
jgi:hypothetical protein